MLIAQRDGDAVLAFHASALEAGAEVELVLGALGKDAEGSELISWMFRPV